MSVSQYIQDRKKDESGFSMVIALLTMIIMISIVASVATLTVMLTKKSSETRDLTYYSSVAESAANEAIWTANNTRTPNPNKPGSQLSGLYKYSIATEDAVLPNAFNKARHGTNFEETGTSQEGIPLRFLWYATEISNVVPDSSYIVNIAVYRSNDVLARNVEHVKELDDHAYFMKVRVESQNVLKAGIIDNRATYYISDTSMTVQGLIGYNKLQFEDVIKLRNYDSSEKDPAKIDPVLGVGTTAENAPYATVGEVVFPNNFVAKQAAEGIVPGGVLSVFGTRDINEVCGTFTNSATNPTPNFAISCPVRSITYPYKINVEDNIDQWLDNCDPTLSFNAYYGDWVSSINGTVFTPTKPGGDYMCIDNLVIDRDTEIPNVNTTGKPFTIYVNGNIQVNNGAKLNTATSSPKAPAALRIKVVGLNSNVTVTSSSGKDSMVNALVSAPQSLCSFITPKNVTTAKTILKGSMQCNQIVTSGRFEYYYDVQARQVQTIELDSVRIWTGTSYTPVASL